MSQRLRSFANRRIPSLQAVVVFASIVLVVASPACADADAIINKGIEALGGEARLAKAQATIRKVRGTYLLSDGNTIEFKGEQTTEGLDRMRSTFEEAIDGDKFTAITVIDDDKGWRKVGEKEVMEMEEEELAEEKWSAFWQAAPLTLLDLKDSKFKTEVVGDVKVDDKPAAGVKVTGTEGKDFTIYFDKKTGLPVKAVADEPDPESPGQEFTQENYYRDYKDFGGIMRAKKIELKHDGKTFIKMELMDFKVLDKVDDKAFAKPE